MVNAKGESGRGTKMYVKKFQKGRITALPIQVQSFVGVDIHLLPILFMVYFHNMTGLKGKQIVHANYMLQKEYFVYRGELKSNAKSGTPIFFSSRS